MVLAVIAVLAVAGPGMVYAVSPTTSYAKPISGVILGPTVVAPSGSAPYTLKVTFSDGTSSDVTGSSTFTAVLGSFTGNTYHAPATTGRDRITATYSNSSGSVVANKIIFVQ